MLTRPLIVMCLLVSAYMVSPVVAQSTDCNGNGIPDICDVGPCACGTGEYLPNATITVEVFTDAFPSETTWELVEETVGVAATGGPFDQPNTLFTQDIPVCSASCYDFHIFDVFGDGICCAAGNGFYNVLLDGVLVGTGGMFFVADTVHNIGDCSLGASSDCNANEIPDECEIADGSSPDCNGNGIPDSCEIASGVDTDCNSNGILDECDVADGVSLDCNTNDIPDECDIGSGTSPDCNTNSIPDECDIANGNSLDNTPVGGDGIPDECQLDCNSNMILDADDIAEGTSADCNFNGIPDECDIADGSNPDCNANGIPDGCDTTFIQKTRITADDAAFFDNFGGSISVSGDTAIIGSPFDDDVGVASGSAYVFVRSGTSWIQQAKITATDGAFFDSFGLSVSISGNTAVIGAQDDDDACPEDFSCNSGSAYIFVRNDTLWTQQAMLTAADDKIGARFGNSVSIDGDTVVIGAQNDHDVVNIAGSAYVFTRNGTTWTQQAKLNAPDGESFDLFGSSVSLSGDTAIVGASRNDFKGSAYVFVRNGEVWTQQVKLNAPDAEGGGRFGHAVSFSGNSVVIGSFTDNDAFTNSGSAYVFVRTSGVWTQQAKLIADDVAAFDHFGISVSINGDTAVIGSHWDDDAGSASGSAYVFVRADGVWTQQAKLTADDAAEGDEFGYAASINGGVAVIGSIFGDSTEIDSGSVYTFSMFSSDCQANSIPDECDIADGTSLDEFPVGGDGIPDECQADCNGNMIPDADELADGTSLDCNNNGMPDECDIAGGTSHDCNGNGLPDECDLGVSNSQDCNANTVPDECDIANGTSLDILPVVGDGIPDDCQSDCNGNQIPDEYDLADGTSQDCNSNGIPDECDIAVGTSMDCNANGFPDECEPQVDCNGNGVLDECDIADGTSLDDLPIGGDGIPDDCQADCNDNLIPDANDLADGTSADCNANNTPDECDIAAGASADCNGNVIPDECESQNDCNGNGIQDICDIAADSSQDCNANSVPDECDLLSFPHQTKLTTTDSFTGDEFGFSVSVDGDLTVIGSRHDDEGFDFDGGSAHVFVRNTGNWTQQALLTADDASRNDEFGFSTSISGNTILIGAPFDFVADPASGSAYIFNFTGGIWSQQFKLTADDAESVDFFGWAVSICGDTAVIGSLGDDDAGPESGSAYVFIRTAGVWTQQAKLIAADGAFGDEFGASVSIDSDTVVIGSRRDDDIENNSGSVYVFVRNAGVWTQQAKLTAADTTGNDGFGWSVSIRNNTLVVGSPGNFVEGVFSGSAYVFVRSGDVWTQETKLIPVPATSGQIFGHVVSLREETVVVGSPFDDSGGTNSGSAYVFVRSGNVWTQQAKLSAADPEHVNWFGFSVSNGGDALFIGAPRDDVFGNDSGSAYIFTQGSADCQADGIPDECEIAEGTSHDCNANGIPDECDGFIDTTPPVINCEIVPAPEGDSEDSEDESEDDGPDQQSGAGTEWGLSSDTGNAGASAPNDSIDTIIQTGFGLINPPGGNRDGIPIYDEGQDGPVMILFDATDDCGEVTVSAILDIGCMQIPVENGTLIDFECVEGDDSGDCEVEEEDGILEIESATVVLIVNATDESGNTATCEIVLCTPPDDSSDDDSGNDNDTNSPDSLRRRPGFGRDRLNGDQPDGAAAKHYR